MNENGPARRAPESAEDGRRAAAAQDGTDGLVWRDRDRERARLLLERANDIARRIERACGSLTEEPLPAGGSRQL